MTPHFDPDTITILDLVAAHPETQAVFRRYDAIAGCCLLCQGLFETVNALAARFSLDRNALVADLEKILREEG